MGSEGWCVWITGLPGSGKSAVSNYLVKLLDKQHIRVQVLSSDALRKTLTPKPSYTLKERDIVYSVLGHIAWLLTTNGVNVVIDATGNLRRYRDHVRDMIERFMEVYLTCPSEICIQREKTRKETFYAPRHIYSKAQRGKAPTVPGLGQPYEAPLKAEVIIDTSLVKPEQAAEEVARELKRRLFFRGSL